MIHYSVVIPQRNSVALVGRLLGQLEDVLTSLILPYEIICVDDGSDASAHAALEGLLAAHSRLRVLRFDEPRGTSGALSAGVAAARGDLVIAVGVHNRTNVRYLPHLIAGLSQNDLVSAEPDRQLADQLRVRVARLLRAWAADRQLHPDEELFWAARHEAISSLALAPGAFRVLDEIVARRGFRVETLTIAAGLPVRSARLRPGRLAKLLAGWIDRSFEPHRASELAASNVARDGFNAAQPAHVRPRDLARPGLLQVEKQSGESA